MESQKVAAFVAVGVFCLVLLGVLLAAKVADWWEAGGVKRSRAGDLAFSSFQKFRTWVFG
jgi:hypothetical protein